MSDHIFTVKNYKRAFEFAFCRSCCDINVTNANLLNLQDCKLFEELFDVSLASYRINHDDIFMCSNCLSQMHAIAEMKKKFEEKQPQDDKKKHKETQKNKI
ncbi:hypothetical protein PVAND_013108 [Polypedilum vanderplanki]|uniref:Uncharacterized protein n=1 Tax=Polypedilum vanderplanki TaxID=319348 RepID=A0A9J6CPD4_POLVA|nr:hypothetical protein PVAND_013108 [Polypedilum vanderplanki]